MTTKISGPLLERELARRGMTQAELARLAGVTEMTISRCKRQRVSTETLKRIAVALARVPVLPGTDLVLAAPPEVGG